MVRLRRQSSEGAGQQRVTTSDHVTAHLCVSADGRFLPTLIIYFGGFPHRQFRDGVPDNWTFSTSDSRYMDGELFFEWFSKMFVPNCGSERPVMLVMDNHDSHITLPVVELARRENVLLVGLPTHTTHFLKPLDVGIIGPLKSRFSAMATNLGIVSPHMIIGKAKFPVVLSHSVDQTTSASVYEAFRKSGLYPVDQSVIDRSQIVSASFVPANESDSELISQPVRTCTTCGSFLVNPLVRQGLVPESLADILIPPAVKPISTKRRKLVTEGRLISGDEMLQQLQQKEEEEKNKQALKEKKKIERDQKQAEKKKEKERKKIERQQKKDKRQELARTTEERKKEKKKENEERRQTSKIEGRLAAAKYTCGVCGVRGRVTDEANGIMWYGCDDDQCASGTGWFHHACLTDSEQEVLAESLTTDGVFFYCKFCIPYEE